MRQNRSGSYRPTDGSDRASSQPVCLGVGPKHERVLADADESALCVERHCSRVPFPHPKPQRLCASGARGLERRFHQGLGHSPVPRAVESESSLRVHIIRPSGCDVVLHLVNAHAGSHHRGRPGGADACSPSAPLEHRVGHRRESRGITIYGQNELVKDLIEARLQTGAPLFFESEDVTLANLRDERPVVRFIHRHTDRLPTGHGEVSSSLPW